MSKWLKGILGAVIALVVIVIVAIIALPFVIDPNSFKGPLERIAAEQNVHLELRGPISWRFFPQLGLSLEGVAIASPEAPEQALVQAAAGTAAVAVRPLFAGRVQVDEFTLDGVAIHLVVDETGRGNWETLGPQNGREADDREPAQAPPSEERGELHIAVERIAITDGSLLYEDRQTGQVIELSQLSIRLNDVNLEDRAFPLNLGARLALSDLPNPLLIDFGSQLRVAPSLDRFALINGQLQVAVGDDGNARLALDLSGEANLEDGLAFQGNLALKPFNPKILLAALGETLPDMEDPSALTSLAFSAKLAGSDTELRADALELNLDHTRFTGNLAMRMPPEQLPTIQLNLSGNRIDVDRYLPPSEEEQAEETPAAGEDEPSPLPLESLRELNADLRLAMDEIVVSAMPITQARMVVTGNAGLWKLEELSADFYEGKLQSQAQLDARSNQADVQFSAHLNGLAVQPLLRDFAEFEDLSGAVSGEVQARTQAVMTNELMENLSAAFVFTSPQLTFEGFNAEYIYCQMATQVSSEEMPDVEWPRRTRITEVEGQITFDDQRLNVAGLMANVENLVLMITGHLDLKTMDYRVRLPMRLAQERTSPSGCVVKSNFLLTRQVDVLGCAGSLDEMNFARQCGLDTRAVSALAGDALRYNVEKRTDEKREEIREDLQEKLRERLGEEGEIDARNLLRNIRRR